MYNLANAELDNQKENKVCPLYDVKYALLGVLSTLLTIVVVFGLCHR